MGVETWLLCGHRSTVVMMLILLLLLLFLSPHAVAVPDEPDLSGLGNLFGGGGSDGDGEPDMGELLGSLFGAFGGMDENDNNAPVASTGGLQQKKRRKRKRKKKTLCEPHEFVAPVSLTTLLNQKPQRQFTANGCGPAGMEVAEPYGLWKCCNGHDVCYSVPGTTFNYCEKAFSACMKQLCTADHKGKDRKECRKQADSFSGMTKLFGRGSHASAQRQTNQCVATKHKAQELWHAFVKEIYVASALAPSAMPSDEGITTALALREGKESEHVDRLIKQHGETFVKKTGSVAIEFFITKKEQKLLGVSGQEQLGEL